MFLEACLMLKKIIFKQDLSLDFEMPVLSGHSHPNLFGRMGFSYTYNLNLSIVLLKIINFKLSSFPHQEVSPLLYLITKSKNSYFCNRLSYRGLSYCFEDKSSRIKIFEVKISNLFKHERPLTSTSLKGHTVD